MSTGRRPLVAGNWKMHGSRASNAALLQALARGLPRTRAAEVAVCPPAPYLELAAAALKDSDIALGAQNLCDQDQPGAFTGEVLGAMLRDVGCTFVIVGHSERRALYGESDEIVARKFRAAQKAQLVPILCVGETLQQREAGETERVLA
ncbi:MAG TPA: triose-phosphate isomerase, partial [Candidatus Binatia bacterium]|nr:triose-phosphate isomerase [Candidatus Binatia bacterium]